MTYEPTLLRLHSLLIHLVKHCSFLGFLATQDDILESADHVHFFYYLSTLALSLYTSVLRYKFLDAMDEIHERA